jgi:hypothetical protein
VTTPLSSLASDYLPTDEVRFLMERSIEPVAAQLGLLEPMS